MVTTIVSVLIFLAGMAFEEAILKPLVISFTKNKLKAYLKPGYDKLDSLIKLPENWEKFQKEKFDWVYNTVVEDTNQYEELAERVKKEVTNELIANFSLEAFLKKEKSDA